MLFSLIHAGLLPKYDGTNPVLMAHLTHTLCAPRNMLYSGSPSLLTGEAAGRLQKGAFPRGVIVRPSFFGRIWVDF
jgi:hypothetical protein